MYAEHLCPDCGGAVSPTDGYCHNEECTVSLKARAVEVEVVDDNKKPFPWVTLLIVAVVVILSCVVFFMK